MKLGLTQLRGNSTNGKSANTDENKSQWTVDRACLLLRSNDTEICDEHHEFYGKLTIEMFYAKGKLTTVKLGREQTFK